MNPTRLLLMVICPAWLAGCQRYAPEPLDLSAHNRAIESRDPASSEVVTYAEQLVRQSGEVPARYDPADGLSLEEAELVALFFNPQLRTARLRARVPLAGAAEAGRWEDPQLNVDAERIIESVEHPWVVGGVIRLTLPLSGRLRIEKEMAQTSAEVEQLRVLAQERQLLAELRRAWLEWSATAERAALTRALLNELDAILQTAEKLRAAGELDPLDARLFRIERLTQAGRLQLLEAQGREEEIALKSRLGLSPSADVRLIPSLIAARQGAAATQEAAGLLELHPRLRVARAEYEMAERALQLEIRRQYPDLAVGGGFASDEGAERLLGGIGLPLPLWNRNRRAIAEATAAREAARAAVEAEYEQLMAEMAGARAALDAAAARREFVETELAPLVDEQLAAARQLGRLGNYNTLVLLEALKAGYEAKAEVVQARLKMGLATARIHALMESARTADRTERDVQP